MKNKLFCILIISLTVISVTGMSQNINYPTKKINGVEFQLYTVQPSEGLLAIGRKFEISADEIIKANPEVKTGLKPGQQLLIPFRNKLENSKLSFLEHKVEKKQTLFAISNSYKVSQEEIKKYNPELDSGLKEGMILKIPIKNHETLNHKTNIKSTETIHKIQPDETLFSISRKYNVSIQDLIKLNPGSDKKLSVNSELKIPSYSEVSKPVEAKETIIAEQPESTAKIEVTIQPKQTEAKVIRIAYLLPFMLEQTKKEAGLDRFLHFYEGALIAIQQAKQKGISLEIFTYDTGNSEEKITEVLNNPELKTVDLIIGPAFSNHVSLVSNFAKEFRINTLIPFSAKVTDIDDNPYLFQFNPGSENELKFLSGIISEKYKKFHLVFAEIQGLNSSDEGKTRNEYIQNQLLRDKKQFSKLELTTPETTNFTPYLKKGITNLIIFNSDKFSNVSPYFNSLRSKSNEYDIVLFEQYNWRIQAEKLPKNVYISPFKPEFNLEQIVTFNALLDQYFGKEAPVESPRFDLLGYDLTSHFITLIQRYGSKFGTKIGLTHSISGIQSEPVFERNSNESGFINKQLYWGEDINVQ